MLRCGPPHGLQSPSARVGEEIMSGGLKALEFAQKFNQNTNIRLHLGRENISHHGLWLFRAVKLGVLVTSAQLVEEWVNTIRAE